MWKQDGLSPSGVVSDHHSAHALKVPNRVFVFHSFLPDFTAERPPDRDFEFEEKLMNSRHHHAAHHHHQSTSALSTSAQTDNQQQETNINRCNTHHHHRQQQPSTTNNKRTVTKRKAAAPTRIKTYTKNGTHDTRTRCCFCFSLLLAFRSCFFAL